MRMFDFMTPVVARSSEPSATSSEEGQAKKSDLGAFDALFGKLADRPVPADEGSSGATLNLPIAAETKPPLSELEALIASLGPNPEGDEAAEGSAKAPVDAELPKDDPTGAGEVGQQVGSAVAIAVSANLIRAAPGDPKSENDQLVSAGPQAPTGDEQASLLDQPKAPLAVHVRSQETHFKPVVEGFVSKPVFGPQAAATDTFGGTETEPGSSAIQFSAPSQKQMPKPADRGVPEAQISSPVAAEGQVGIPPDSGAGLSAGMLQKITGAVLDEAKQLSQQVRHPLQESQPASFIATARASESAVRKLTIQLHPADLGLMTINMKLSGDNLEMDVSVASEEVAQMLRRDSDGLNAVLRTSGYRPDIISIHVAPSSQTQDGSFQNSRQQPQQQTFDQSENQGGGSQNRGKFHEPTDDTREAGEQHEGNLHRRSIGGTYL